MRVDKVVVGKLCTNCYILSIGAYCLVIDPGDDYFKIKNAISDKFVVGVIITHRHFDHIGALKYFNNIYDKTNLKEGINTIDCFKFEVIYTPGHTEDSICIYFKDDNIMFVGDFIFKDGIGRTDLGGSEYQMLQSLVKISNYNNNIKIYPGHGKSSTLGIELKHLLN